jgi:hypothetical protein
MELRGIGINLLGMAVNGFAARGQNPTLSSPSLCRQARELSLAAGGSTRAQLAKIRRNCGIDHRPRDASRNS